GKKFGMPTYIIFEVEFIYAFRNDFIIFYENGPKWLSAFFYVVNGKFNSSLHESIHFIASAKKITFEQLAFSPIPMVQYKHRLYTRAYSPQKFHLLTLFHCPVQFFRILALYHINLYFFFSIHLLLYR